MKQKIVISVFITFCIVLFTKNIVKAKSYSIENMDIQATVNQDGSLGITQEIKYKFNGQYNGIYINVPYNLEDIEASQIVKNNRINDNLYNGQDVVIQAVSVINNDEEIKFKQVDNAVKGSDSVYTNNKSKGMSNLKVYSPSLNETKLFRIKYVISNLCVKHKDIGELYYNFIGGAWDVEIKKLEITIHIPENEQEIYVWGHGPYNGTSKIINNKIAKFTVSNVKPGQYVAARVLFDNSNIAYSNKLSNIEAKDYVFRDENTIVENKEEKNKYTSKVIIFSLCLFIYWVVLMMIFEKDKKYYVSDLDDEEMFKKYNPMVAGCIQGSRTILARDIIAVILELINKKVINLELIPSVDINDDYIYKISKNKEKEDIMDEVEKYVYDWVFESNDSVVLQNRLQEIPKEKDANEKFKELDKIVQEKLNKTGANQAKVPFVVRVFNTFLFILTILIVINHISFNGFSLYNPKTTIAVMKFIGLVAVAFFPLVMGLLYLPINLIIMIRHKVNNTVQKVSGQKVVTTTISVIVLFGFIIALTAFLSPMKYLIADEIAICIATIIILTDNLMLKNNVLMIEDFSKINTIKYKIQNYSIMEDKDIEQVVLWERYLSYAISFGLASKILKRLQNLYLDDDLTKLLFDQSIYRLLNTDYYAFYNYASVESRFLKTYGEFTSKAISEMGKGGYSSSDGHGGGFSGGGGYSGGGGRGRRPEVHFSI